MAMIMMQDFHTTTDDDAYHCPSSSFPHSQPNNHCENRQTMIARWKDGFVSPTTSASESAASLLNLFGGGCNDNLNPIPTASTTTTASTSTTTTTTTMDAGAVMLLSRGQQQLLPRRGRLSQCNRRHLPDGENANIGNRNTAITTTTTTTRPVLLFQRTPTRVRFTTMTGILFLLPVSLLMSSCTTVALVYHTNLLLPTNILARRVVTNGGKKISILSTTSSSSTSLFYKFDANDSYSDPTTASATSTANSNNKNGGEEGGNNNNNSCINSTNHSPLQFARAKRARKLHRHPSKKAKKKSGKESNDDIIVELLPSTFSNGDYYFNDDDDDDDEQTPFILSEPGEGESWTPPLPTVSSTSSSTASSFSASARRTTTASSPSSTSESCSKLDRHPALVLNADYQPLRMLPLSIWSWQDTIKAVLSGKAVVVDIHPNVFVRAVSLDMPVPSVIALREYAPTGKARPAFTRRNVFLRDGYRCQYCSNLFRMSELSLDHVEPRCMGGKLTWENTVTCCMKCNGRKGCLRPNELHRVGMELKSRPKCPTLYELAASASNFVPRRVHPTWAPFLGMTLVSSDGAGGGYGGASVMASTAE